MKPLNTHYSSSADNADISFDHWHAEQLPAGPEFFCFKKMSLSHNLSLPVFGKEGLILTFLDFQGELEIVMEGGQQYLLLNTGPGMGILSAPGDRLTLRPASPVTAAAVRILMPSGWADHFLRSSASFQEITDPSVCDRLLTARLSRKQAPLLSALIDTGLRDTGIATGLADTGLSDQPKEPATQSRVLTLIEYFLCNCHRDRLRKELPASLGNDEDLVLVRQVESYISEYYCSDAFTVDTILKKTFTSYHKLNFLFKSIHGMTISEYIRNKRIERSREMIADNAKSISQIAYEIGYSSISNYILAFKKIYSITPGKYKKQLDSVA